MSEYIRKDYNAINKAMIVIAALGAGALGIAKYTESKTKSVVVDSNTAACATSPKAESGDTKWELERKVYPNLDAISEDKISVESSSQDWFIRPGDTVRVCVPLQDVNLALKKD